ncbi:hypothetical protein DFJ43DRAFT_1072590 [Lentinula guzmanii]|uniref:G-protein coupled receptors family 2 profile 2 domain-containing protein n=1 Tax=Lentinula guzmanii TaxID=2804957 RepID=A0AA38JLU2_9AGAR|nr:hypothetical protein DFJ43DRAFT_1072590 [Lentinula guzmanii]
MFPAITSNLLWAVTSAVGAGLCFLVLLAISAVWWHPTSRPHLDRVSFRIVMIALFANMIFGIASAVGGTMTHGGFLCGFSIFVLQWTLQISSFLLFSIALNLQLVVVNGFNGQNMEKFYIIVSFVFATVLTVPPYAANQYGWDPLEQDCWYKNDNLGQRLAWQISTQMAWTAITALGEIIASTSVMLFMVKHHVRTRRVFLSTQSISRSSSNSPQVIHANSYKRIILRIALYPLASCFVNLLSIFTALHSTIADGIHNQTDYNILLLSDFLYGGRAIVYALLAASDPALIRGVKTLYRVIRGTHAPDTDSGKQYSTADNQGRSDGLVVHVELTAINEAYAHDLEERTPKQTELGFLGTTKDPQPHEESRPVNLTRASPNLPELHRTSRNFTTLDIQRREEALRKEEAAFNKQI